MAKLSTKKRHKLSSDEYAFPKKRKEPIENAEHVRDAIARFDQVQGVSNKERNEAWDRITKAAKKYDIDMSENSWQELFKRNHHPIPQS